MTNEWRKNNRERYNELCRKYWAEGKRGDPEKMRRRKRVTQIRSFGITIEYHAEMLEKQQNKCYICNNEETQVRNGKVKELAIDHCHKTKKVRKLVS